MTASVPLTVDAPRSIAFASRSDTLFADVSPTVEKLFDALLRSIFLAAFVRNRGRTCDRQRTALCHRLSGRHAELATNRRRAQHECVGVVERHVIAGTNRDGRKVVRFVEGNVFASSGERRRSSDCRGT